MELFKYIDEGGQFGDFPEGDLFPRGINSLVNDIANLVDRVPSPIKSIIAQSSERIIKKVLDATNIPAVEDDSLAPTSTVLKVMQNDS